ncbi:MAG: NTP transferase domain-containing protein [Blautia marasmi]
MSYQADNAVILAAGLSSRFAPISYEMPKALIPVRGEILIERQIRQLREAGIDQVIVVTGYKAEMFEYLKEKLGVILVHNREYQEKNNHSSIYAVREYLKNTYICCGDNYFNINPFEKMWSRATTPPCTQSGRRMSGVWRRTGTASSPP